MQEAQQGCSARKAEPSVEAQQRGEVLQLEAFLVERAQLALGLAEEGLVVLQPHVEQGVLDVADADAASHECPAGQCVFVA